MTQRVEEARAPCVAVVGPAGSGKTTFLHLLDRALQLHPQQPLVYVLKGNPDGTGRYLLHAPGLREALKPRVKGAWSSLTVATIAEWIDHCRQRLELVLLDFGGRHAGANEGLLRRCSHFLVVARRFADSEKEREDGMESWIRAGRQAGLQLVARVRSLWGDGEPTVLRGRDGVLDAAFRADRCTPAHATNASVIEAIAALLLRLRRLSASVSYVDLRLGRDWSFDDLPALAGLTPRLEEAVERGEAVLGGRAPIWVYAAALHRLLDSSPDIAVEVFDPKTPTGLVPIPRTLNGPSTQAAAECLDVRWAAQRSGKGSLLDLEITTPDRFLPLDFVRHLPSLPLPQEPPPPGPIVVSGAGPIWLHLAYSRWLRSLPGLRPLGVWDARSEAAVFVTGPASPYQLPWAVA